MKHMCSTNPTSLSICPSSTIKTQASLETNENPLRKSNFSGYSAQSQSPTSLEDMSDNPISISDLTFYQTNSKILARSSISNLHRARLKFWLMFELTNCQFYRETYATASKYLDMYFMKGNDIGIDSLQTLGLSCFTLASKVVESRTPLISFESFNKKQLFQLQRKLCFNFHFKLNPTTYVGLAQVILNSWDNFSNQHQISYPQKYFQDSRNSTNNFRSIMQLLDCIDLTLQSLDFHQPSLIISLFFLENRYNCLKKTHPKTQSQIKSMLSKKDEYRRLFSQFHETLQNKHEIFQDSRVEKSIIEFLLPFLNLKKKAYESRNESYSFRHHLCLQTHNQHAYSHAKTISAKLNSK